MHIYIFLFFILCCCKIFFFSTCNINTIVNKKMGNLSSGLNKPCDIFKVIKMVEGTRATSSSRSESWFIYVDNGGKTLEKLFMKFFLSPRSNFEDIVDNKTILKYVDNRKTYVGRQSLDYESRVYSKIISVILREGVNPSFGLSPCRVDRLFHLILL